VLDIGGQDSKAIALDGRGAVRRFEMNDKCAAGTGRFLETMTLALGCGLEGFSRLAEEVAVSSGACRTLNSTCTVFAESEVVSLIARGESRGGIARGIVEAVAGRAAALVRRVDTPETLVLIGGLARCTALRQALSRRLDCPVQAPDGAQTVVALGCALAAMEENR
jgi:predicted CoA-substrate-specific enzyme activase